MNSILSIFVGRQSQLLAYNFYHFQAQQIFSQGDVVDHDVLWQNVDKHVPRMVMYDFKNEIKALEHINNTKHSKIIQKLEQSPVEMQLNYTDLESQIKKQLGQLKNQQQMEPEKDPIMNNFNNFMPLQQQCVEINKYQADSQWNIYHAGEGIVSTSEKVKYWVIKLEMLMEPIRRQLEVQDYLDGFVMFSDAYQGHGIITERLLDSIKDQCHKKPIMLFPVYEPVERMPEKEKEYFYMNQLIVNSNLRKKSQIFVPFCLKLPTNRYFEPVDNFDVYRHMAPLISQLYTPFSLKNSLRLSQYVSNMRPFEWNSLFNIAYTLPLISQGEIQKGYNIMEYSDMELKNLLDYVRPLYVQKKSQNKYEAYSESYVFRHPIDLKKYEIKSRGIDIKMLENIFYQREDDNLIFHKRYHEAYGKDVLSFPFSSVLFSHELLKTEIQWFLADSEKLSTSVVNNYYRLGVQRDEFKQMRQDLQQLYDSYDRCRSDFDSDVD